MQGTRWRSIVATVGVATTVALAGCGRTGTAARARAERPVTAAIGCGDRRDGAGTVATAPRFGVTPVGVLVTPAVVPGMTAVGPCRDLQVTPGVLGPDPTCLDIRSVVRDALHRQVSWWCRPAGPGVDPGANGHPGGMSDTPPTKPLPDLPDEPVPTPMPKDPPLPQPGQPSG